MKQTTRIAARGLAATVCLAIAIPAHAMLPVFDIPNFIVNAINKHTLFGIRNELHSAENEGTVAHNTFIIDKSTQLSANIAIENTNIDNDFTWIINTGGDEVIPIPKDLEVELQKIMNWEDTAAFTAQFKSAEQYAESPNGSGPQIAMIDGSRARKAANDTLIKSLAMQQKTFEKESDDLKMLADKVVTTKGHGNQLQISNAMAATQVNQLMKLRSMMVVSEASRAVEAQIAADKDARSIVVGNHLRTGLHSAASQSLMPLSTY